MMAKNSVPVRLAVAALLVYGLAASACTRGESEIAGGPDAIRPNILFISVDDLNDWIEPLGGHPQARTPNLNRLADVLWLLAREAERRS